MAPCLFSGDPCSFIEKGIGRIEEGIELVHLIEGEAIMGFWSRKIKNIYIFSSFMQQYNVYYKCLIYIDLEEWSERNGVSR